VIAIDGKTLRATYKHDQKRSLIHMVSAWATQNRLVLGQRKVDEKSNEITAIPELLKMLELKDALVTIDAMGCQKKIAEQIISQQADYVLALKGNQGNLYEDVVQLFESACWSEQTDIDAQYHQTTERGHGRRESRRYSIVRQTEHLVDSSEWVGLNSIGCVESQRDYNNQITIERRYYILSISLNASQFADAVRSHWGIENQLHWILDVAETRGSRSLLSRL
jgi:predicted transposase YbfD/YdcC